MLFNTFDFIFAFLPLTLIGFIFFSVYGYRLMAMSWLVAASLFFYGWWNPAYLGLIIASILFNYALGDTFKSLSDIGRKFLLFIGVSLNILVLAYFKYANFFVDNINLLAETSYHLEKIILPLAISFFTFQQIAYLVDTYKGKTREHNFLYYCLFVTFFPQLIAGPIVHHSEMMPQFSRLIKLNALYRNIAIGITIFSIGLFKKVILADSVALYSSPVFLAADSGATFGFFEAWMGALSYTFQLYFDFSAYSDMAIGVARMFGIKLPLNFNSPYKAVNIISFWRRWHITLSRFLRDYLYIPLGGSRKGTVIRYRNLMITMLLGGLWHGAGWNFILWGGLHGMYLIINSGWQQLPALKFVPLALRRGSAWLITFVSVVFAWIPFRAETLDGTMSLWRGMCGLNGVQLPSGFLHHLNHFAGFGDWLNSIGVEFIYLGKYATTSSLLLVIALLIVCLALPNAQQLLYRYKPAWETYDGEIVRPALKVFCWQPTVLWAIFTSALLVSALMNMNKISEFLYFQF